MRSIAKYYALAGKAWGRELLNGAELWLDAADVSGQTLPNSGTGGSALDATLGSSSAAEPTTNDPMVLAHDGTNYLYLPGVSGNTASTPDSAALDITGDLEIVLRTAQDDWTPATNHYPIGKRATTGNQRSWLVENLSTGAVRLYWSADGAAENSALSTASVGFADGAVGWIKITLDVDNGASGRDIKFYTAPDQATEPTSWTQLGTTITQAGVTSIFSGTADLRLGGWQDGTSVNGAKYLRAIVRNGIGGTVAFDADFTTGITAGSQTSVTESSANAATVTINRSTSGRKAVAVVRPTMLFGTDDFAFVPDNDLLDFAAGDSFTALAAFRSWNTQGTNDTLIAKKANTTDTTQGWSLSNGSSTALNGQAQIGDGVDGDTATSASRTVGALSTVAMVRDVAADTLTVFTNATAGTPVADTLTGSLANSEQLRIGRLSGAGTEYADMEFFGAAVFRRALSAAEIEAIVDYFEAA
jgi:hypothetical protein